LRTFDLGTADSSDLWRAFGPAAGYAAREASVDAGSPLMHQCGRPGVRTVNR
jgi:hypothetical protein